MTDEEKAKQMMQWALQPEAAEPVLESEAAEGEIPGYEIEKILGQGGMGAVYKARHRELGRVVAIKVFSSTDENADLFVERLKKEGRLMAQLEHPNVLGIHDASVTEDGTPYLILEYIDGMDLFVRMKNAETLSEKEAIRVATAVCNGLDAVHGIGIVHRDIKPANILLGNDGSIKVSDFGISKDVADTAGTQLTLTGTTVGTVDYMSPEHSAGKELDSRADIYSVGVMLYEMIAGVTPRGAFEPLTNFGASKPMEKLVMKCLQRDREQRVGSAKALAEELAKVRQKLINRGMPAWKQTAIGAGAGLVTVAALMAALKGFSTNKDPKLEVNQPTEKLNPMGEVNSAREMPADLADLKPPHGGVDNTMWKGSHWEQLKPITDAFEPSDHFIRDGGSLVSEPKGINSIFSKIQPGDRYVLQLKWKRYTGDQSIGLLLPTKYGNTIFEMGAWHKELIGLQGYRSGKRMITMDKLRGQDKFIPNRPMRYNLKNGIYHNLRVHVDGDKVAILMKRADKSEYRKVGYYDLAGKRWGVPMVWRLRHFKTIGLCSYNSQMYVSDIQFKKLR